MKYLILLTTSLAITALDQAVKLYIHTHFALGESMDIIPGFFSFTYVRNAGGAFGIFSSTNEVLRTILFIIFPLIAFFIIFNIIQKIRHKELIPIIALSFILGGALGNFIDRVHFQYVIDFLDFHIPSGWAFPTFNLADSFIVIGVFIVAWISYKHPEKIPL
ncbi:MAG: signal peptidase II [Bdellovibrionales bacterium]|nr:signal peptidase II [Bdellovibrionales bacterium]